MRHPRRVEIDADKGIVRLLSLKPRKTVTNNIEMEYDEMTHLAGEYVGTARQDAETVSGMKVFLIEGGERRTIYDSSVGEVRESEESKEEGENNGKVVEEETSPQR